MANMRLAMDSTFWDLNVASPQTLDGTARFVPGEPIPLDGARASRSLRRQQLSILSRGFPFGLIPSYYPTSQKEHPSYSLQSLLLRRSYSNWWLGLIGQIRPEKLLSSVKSEIVTDDKIRFSTVKRIAGHFFDKSLYSLGLCTQISLGPASSLFLSTEKQGERKERCSKAIFLHQLPQHEITMEAAWPELFVDRNGGYWDVPESVSLDLSSIISDSGLKYRFGIHRNKGQPQAVNGTNGEPPLALMPGLCAKAAFSYEKSRDIWRQKEIKADDGGTKAHAKRRKADAKRKRDKGLAWWPYDVRLKEPHAAISGIIGGTCTAWFTGNNGSVAEGIQVGDSEAVTFRPQIRKPLSADLYGSLCYTFQHGKFSKLYGDLTRVDARLDICSALAFAKGAGNLVTNVFRSSSVRKELNPLASPRLNVILQQQVAGPIVFRVDSKFSLDSASSEYRGAHIEDIIYSLNYSLRVLGSGKVVAWYSPKRKEGMVELRLFEF